MTASFWASLSSYCSELAPVAGPLFAAVGDTAAAIDRAGRSDSALTTKASRLEALLHAEDD